MSQSLNRRKCQYAGRCGVLNEYRFNEGVRKIRNPQGTSGLYSERVSDVKEECE